MTDLSELPELPKVSVASERSSCPHKTHGWCVDCASSQVITGQHDAAPFHMSIEITGDEEINHPPHYTYGKYESIDVIEGLGLGKGFNRGNAMKYLSRAGHKGGPEKELEDLQKARWYIDREISRLGGENG